MALRPSLSGALAGLAVAASLGAFLLPVSNPDLFWHLSAARWILANRAVPGFDWLSWTMPGQPWTDFEWAAQLLWHAARAAAGSWGLLGVKAALFAGAGLCLWRTLKLYGLPVEARGLGLLAWSLALMPSNDLRPENFSLLFFCLEWLALEAHRLGKRDLGEPLPRAGAAVLFACWANLHPGFLYGLALAGFYAVCELSERRWGLAVTMLAAAAATAVNPYGAGLYRVALAHAQAIGELSRYLEEWGPPSLTNPYMFPFWGALAAAWLAVAARRLQSKDVPAAHLAAMAFFCASAVRHARTTLYFSSVAVPAAALQLGRMEWGPWKKGFNAAMAVAAVYLGLFWCLLVAPRISLATPFWDRFLSARAAAFLRAERAVLGGKRLYNPWHWGGYLGYALYPDYRVFADGRYIFHPLLKSIQEGKETPERYQEFLDGRGVELVVLERRGQARPMEVHLKDGRRTTLRRPVYLDFLPRKDWAMVFWDPRCMIFVRRSAVQASWLRSKEYRVFRPDDFPAAELMVREGAVTRREFLEEKRRLVASADGPPAVVP